MMSFCWFLIFFACLLISPAIALCVSLVIFKTTITIIHPITASHPSNYHTHCIQSLHHNHNPNHPLHHTRPTITASPSHHNHPIFQQHPLLILNIMHPRPTITATPFHHYHPRIQQSFATPSYYTRNIYNLGTSLRNIYTCFVQGDPCVLSNPVYGPY